MRLPLFAMMCTFTVFSVLNVFSNLFLSVYVWKQNMALPAVVWFHICTFSFIFIGVLIGAYMIYWFGSRLSFFLSSSLAMCLFFYLYHSSSLSMSIQLTIIGILNGLYIGLFYAGFNFYTLWFAEESRLSNVVSLQYIINGIVQLFFPILAGWYVYMFDYSSAFFLALWILALQTICSTATPQIKIRAPYRRTSFFIPKNRKTGYMGLASASYGYFFCFVQMSFSILMYLYVKNEFLLGGWNMLFATLGFFTYFILGRIFLRPYHEIIGQIGVILSTMISLCLFFSVPLVIIIFSTVVSVSLPMLWVPSFTRQFMYIREQVKSAKVNPLTDTMQLLVFREFFIGLGKVFFLLLFMFNVMFGQPLSSTMIMLLAFMPSAILVFSKKLIHQGL